MSRAWGMVAAAALLAAGAWLWHRQAPAPSRSTASSGAAARLQEAYPLVAGDVKTPVVSPELLQQIAQANPFAMARRAKPPAPDGGPGGSAATGAPKAPPPPQFIYKGRVELGSKRRAIIAERVSGKTYFLEVGQEVAGFKVLDITENQVLLSNAKTQEDITVALSTPARP